MKYDQQELALELVSFIHDRQRSWGDIKDFVVNTLNMTIENWLFVRGALQIVRNAGLVERTNDIRVEEYFHV